MRQLLSLAPILVSLCALLVSLGSFLIAWRGLRTSVVPTIIFSYGPHGWIFENVGNGPALNLMLYDGHGGQWEREC
jgi:hypothetical protein